MHVGEKKETKKKPPGGELYQSTFKKLYTEMYTFQTCFIIS